MSFERIWHGSYAPGVPRELDFEKITMPEILTRTAGRFPDRPALIFMGKKVSYRELEALVNRFARALTAIGVKQGDKVALLLPNMPQFVIANYAALRIGAVAVMNNPLATEEELTDQLNESDSTTLVTLDLLFPRMVALKGKTGIRSIVACHITDYLPFPGNKLFPYLQKALYLKIPPEPGIYEFLPFLNNQPDTPVENSARWEEVGALIYSRRDGGGEQGGPLDPREHLQQRPAAPGLVSRPERRRGEHPGNLSLLSSRRLDGGAEPVDSCRLDRRPRPASRSAGRHRDRRET